MQGQSNISSCCFGGSVDIFSGMVSVVLVLWGVDPILVYSSLDLRTKLCCTASGK